MGRKTEKSLAKQAKLKESKRQLVLAQNAIKKANSLPDPLDDFPAFRSFNRNGLTINLECKRVTDLPSDIFDQLFALLKKNMEHLYKTCNWGWDEEKKRAEMAEPAAWYLVAYDSDKRPVGFSHFRFDIDYAIEVLYVYELQLCDEVRRKGLGRFMQQVLELIAFKNHMRKVRLTVFKHNEEAQDFYKSMKYTLDETSPIDDFEEQFCYFILSKSNKIVDS